MIYRLQKLSPFTKIFSSSIFSSLVSILLVSRIYVAFIFKNAVFSRSFAIPVSTRPEPLSGCCLLVSLYRFTSTESFASRNRISYLIPFSSICSRSFSNPEISCPLRTSTPNATFFIEVSEFSIICTNPGNIAIGRLSTQKYPISSSILSAVDFPAPDIPVTITKRISKLSYSSYFRFQTDS